MKLSDNLTKIRKDNDLTQEQLAKKMKISVSKLSKYENGKDYPDIRELERFCTIFSLSLEDLLESKKFLTKKNVAKEYTQFARGISFGFFVLLLSITLYFLFSNYDKTHILSISCLLTGIICAIGIFIYYGMLFEDSYFKLKQKEKAYTNQEKKVTLKLVNKILLISTILTILGIIEYNILSIVSINIRIGVCGFFLSISLPAIMYAGILSSRFEKKEKKENPIAMRLSGMIMLIAVCVFFYMGIKKGLWHPYWLLFPAAGIISGIINTIFKKHN